MMEVGVSWSNNQNNKDDIPVHKSSALDNQLTLAVPKSSPMSRHIL
jgi:hypothetical protein